MNDELGKMYADETEVEVRRNWYNKKGINFDLLVQCIDNNIALNITEKNWLKSLMLKDWQGY